MNKMTRHHERGDYESSTQEEIARLQREIAHWKDVVRRLGRDATIDASIAPSLDDDEDLLSFSARRRRNDSKIASLAFPGSENTNGKDSRKSYARPPPLFRLSEYEGVASTCARQQEQKAAINALLAEEVRKVLPKDDNSSFQHIYDRKEHQQVHPWQRIALLIDSPQLGTTRALLQNVPDFPATQIMIPQYDQRHYLRMIHHAAETVDSGITDHTANDDSSTGSAPSTVASTPSPKSSNSMLSAQEQAENDCIQAQSKTSRPPLKAEARPPPIPNVRCQRLDHWLIANRSVGYDCVLFFADMEGNIVGHKEKRLSPAKDIMRYFRYGYPSRGTASILAVTLDLRDGKFSLEDVIDFVHTEASINTYSAETIQTFSYGMGCVVFRVVSSLPQLSNK
ncbi:unnamed protein product [Amoebophrya sp. A25]|nr:unnamed protein product [Amoebophrya sp. A25]|eukprot:GSA25T00010307001.1